MIKYICDGCGKEQPADKTTRGELVKPFDWFVRGDKDGDQHACSRPCIETVSKKTGKTNVVLPI